MGKGNLENILENLINESDGEKFRTSIGSINVHTYNISEWDKCKTKFGDTPFDDVEESDFNVVWDVDIDYRERGIYGISTSIEDIRGTFDFIRYNEETKNDQSIGEIEFGKDDLEKMTILNDPRVSGTGQLLIIGIELDFKRNTVTIVYY